MNKNTYASIAIMTFGVFFLGSVAQADHHCPNVASMRLTAKENHLDLNDNAPVCAEANENGDVDFTFRIRIANPVAVVAGQVRAVQKEQGVPAITIEGDNSEEANQLKIHVTGVAEPNGDEIFSYFIKVDEIGYLDPKVRVVDSDSSRMYVAKGLEDYLDAYDLTVDDAEQLLRTIKAE